VAVLDQILARASQCKRRIVFPESNDPRTIGAVVRLARDGIVEPVLLDPGGEWDRSSLPGVVEVVRPAGHGGHAACVAAAEEARRERGDGAELIEGLAQLEGEEVGAVDGLAYGRGKLDRAVDGVPGGADGSALPFADHHRFTHRGRGLIG